MRGLITNHSWIDSSANFLIPCILKDHLPHLVTNILPVSDEVSSLVVCQHRGAFLFEDDQNCFGARAPTTILIAGDLSERSRDAVELHGHAPLDEHGPLNLTARAAGFRDLVDHLEQIEC
jgi:hypothetical protein